MPQTLEQLESRLKETADKIEKAVDDLKKETATKKEVVDLIDERTKEDKEFLAAHKESIKQINTGFVETKQAIEEMEKKLSNLRNLRASSLVGSPGITSIEVEAGMLRVATTDLQGLGRQVPGVARSVDARLTRFEPEDESLESVFRYLVRRR